MYVDVQLQSPVCLESMCPTAYLPFLLIHPCKSLNIQHILFIFPNRPLFLLRTLSPTCSLWEKKPERYSQGFLPSHYTFITTSCPFCLTSISMNPASPLSFHPRPLILLTSPPSISWHLQPLPSSSHSPCCLHSFQKQTQTLHVTLLFQDVCSNNLGLCDIQPQNVMMQNVIQNREIFLSFSLLSLSHTVLFVYNVQHTASPFSTGILDTVVARCQLKLESSEA